ncbi:RSVR protein, partial [Struthidea cinerea]|nr:RSVR protein [Struthidea cinerea]
PDEFQCAPGAPCFPRDWRCDGHPDSGGREWGRQAGSKPLFPAVSRRSGAAAVTAGHYQGSEWVSACALSFPGLLSILVAAGSVAVWGLSEAKRRSDTFSFAKAAREQLMPDQSQ